MDVALKNKMDLSLGVALGSSSQIALLVVPFSVPRAVRDGFCLPVSCWVLKVEHEHMKVFEWFCLDWLDGFVRSQEKEEGILPNKASKDEMYKVRQADLMR